MHCRKMHHRVAPRRTRGRWARFFPAIAGLTSLACCTCSAQRSALAPASSSPPDLVAATNLSSAIDLPARIDLPAVTALPKDTPSKDTLPEETLPDAPTPSIDLPASGGGDADGNNPDISVSEVGGPQHQTEKPNAPGFPPVSPTPRRLPPSPAEHPSIPSLPAPCQTGISTSAPDNISCAKNVDYFQRFTDSGIHPLTPRQKGKLAFRNTIDPFNFTTIAVFSAISVASDPGSAYGPGVPGFARNFGVAYCETAVGQFFGTFLIPSIAHQDPHYHRMPNASYVRRTVHAITEVVWAQGDYGVGMPNYSTLIGTGISDALGDLYVPGRDTSLGATAARYATAIATDPIDNFITEFLPDVARHVNVHIVLVQQVVNGVERTN
jgi:hypothetical protein